LGLALAIMGLVSIWAFVSGQYPNASENPAPSVSLIVAPAAAGAVSL
jgi:hypothetical protein